MSYSEFCERYGRMHRFYDIMLNGWLSVLRLVDTSNCNQEIFDDIREFLRDFYDLDEDTTMWVEYEKVDNIRMLYERRYKVWKSYINVLNNK